MERFSGKTAVVTGAGGGIGSAIIRELLKWKINVVGLDVNEDQLKALQDEFTQKKVLYAGELFAGKFYPVKCDVTKDEEIQKAFEWINDNLKSVSILVNGAGILEAQDKDIENVSAEVVNRILDVNIKGTILCAKKAMNVMIANLEPGHIINICSITGYDSCCPKGIMTYTASKQAVRAFSEGMRREITRKRLNIKVTTLSPGVVNTPLIADIIPGDRNNREEFLPPDDLARGCISILSTPQHVLFSECIIEPIYRII